MILKDKVKFFGVSSFILIIFILLFGFSYPVDKYIIGNIVESNKIQLIQMVGIKKDYFAVGQDITINYNFNNYKVHINDIIYDENITFLHLNAYIKISNDITTLKYKTGSEKLLFYIINNVF